MTSLTTTTQFGASATFSAVLPPRKTDFDINIKSVQNKVTDPRLKAYAYRDGVSITALRQWCWQVSYTTTTKPQQEQVSIGYPIGDFEGWGFIGSGYFGRTHDGVTLIERGCDTLNVFDDWQNMLALESQDYALLEFSRGDCLILNHTDAPSALQRVGKALSGRYRFVSFFNPRTQSVLQKHLHYKLGVNGYWCDQTFMLFGCYDWRDWWHCLIDNGHKRPVWRSCLRCKNYPSCLPLRGRWECVCERYNPIGEAGKPRYAKSNV